MSDIPRLPGFMQQTSLGALAANNYSGREISPPGRIACDPPLSESPFRQLGKKEKQVHLLRLGAAMEKLHFTASDRGAPESEGIEAARALAMVSLKHFDAIIYALRSAGGATKP